MDVSMTDRREPDVLETSYSLEYGYVELYVDRERSTLALSFEIERECLFNIACVVAKRSVLSPP